MYKHVLCLYPYREDLKRGRYVPPVGLEIIARVLQPFAEEVTVIDLRHERSGAADFVRPDTDLVCVSINWESDLDFLRAQLRAIPPGPLVVAGGRHATELPEAWLRDEPRIDLLVRGDGEETVEALARGERWDEIAGLSFRREGEIVHTPNRKYQPIRDDLYPDRRLRRYRYGIDFEGAESGLRFDAIAGSRGCPFHCAFCSFNLNPWGEKRPYSARSAASVVREIEETEAEVVIFTDDVFTHDPGRVEEICDLLAARGIRKRFIVNSRLEISRRMDVVKKMERAGFAALLLGIESAQDKTLRSMRKGFDTAAIERHFQSLRQTRMLLHGYFILGCIGESEEEMLAIASFARRLGLDTLGLSTLRSVAHDGLRDLVAGTPGYHISESGHVYSDAISRKDLRRIRRLINRRFYSPGHILGVTWKLLRGGVAPPRLLARILATGARGLAARYLRHRQKPPALSLPA